MLSRDPEEAARQLLFNVGQRKFNKLTGTFGREQNAFDLAGAGISRQQRIGGGKGLEETLKRRIELRRQEAQAIDSMRQRSIDLLEREKKRLFTLKQQVQVQKDSVRSQQASVGRLDPGQQSQLRRLIAKAKRGDTLNRDQLNQLGNLGGGIAGVGRFVQKQFAGRDSGLTALGKELDPDKDRFGAKLTGPGSRLQKATDSLKLQKDAFGDFAEDMSQNIKDRTREIKKIINIIKEEQKELADVRREIANLQSEQQQRELGDRQ